MPQKSNEGFTKSAQKTKFIRHRDIKLKGKEIKKEQHIQKAMCEGVCQRCREKVQWRFHFDKYKPLKNPASCQQCRQKSVTKAYRTLCDPCATKKIVCPGCCLPIVNGITEDPEGVDNSEEANVSTSANNECTTDTSVAVDNTAENDEEFDDDEGDCFDDDADHDDDSKDGYNDDSKDEEMTGLEKNASNEAALSSAAGVGGDAGRETVGIDWDDRKFSQYATQKYSKTRVVGAHDDTSMTLS